MSRRVRHEVAGADQAPVTTALRARTRLRLSMTDVFVLAALGGLFAKLQGADLALRAAAGPDHDKDIWAERKRSLTKESSSRWAGRVTKKSNDAYATAMRNQRRALADKQKAIAVISEKLARPVHSQAQRKSLAQKEAGRAKAEGRKPRTLVFGYRSEEEHYQKRRRLQVLVAGAERLEADVRSGRVHVVLGGKRLAKNRLHLGQASKTVPDWRAAWAAKRWSFGANGEAGKSLGNETIRVWLDGTVEIDLPPALAHLANATAHGRTCYRLDAKAVFAYRANEWEEQARAGRAIAYDICFSPKGRVYLDASFTPAGAPDVPSFAKLLGGPGLKVLSADLNHGFLAPAVLDRSGNPLHRLPDIPLLTEDLPAAQRDGHLRQAITDLLDMAVAYGCRLVVVENLGFDEMRATGREKYGSRKWSRKVVCGIPTRQFRDRLVAMASRRGIAVASTPAAYSSIWGAQHWQGPMSTKHQKASRHTAAAVVLGRRALGHSARRRSQASPGRAVPGQRTEEAEAPEGAVSAAGAESCHVSGAGRTGTRKSTQGKPSRREGNLYRRHLAKGMECETRERRNGTAPMYPAKTVRAGPGDRSLSLSS